MATNIRTAELITVDKERYAARRGITVPIERWLHNVNSAHAGMELRRVVQIDGESIAALLDVTRCSAISSIEERMARLKVTTRAGWRETGKVGKLTLDDWMLKQTDGEYDTGRSGRKLAEVLSAQRKLRAGDGYTVVITTEPAAFLRMACMKCDRGSCFRAGCQYEYAPLIIAENHGTFIGYIKDGNDEVKARCWGMEHGADWLITNIYQRGVSGDCSKQVFTLAMQELHGESPTGTVSIGECTGVYLNGDNIGTADHEHRWYLETVSGFVRGCTCDHCGDRCHDEECTIVDDNAVCDNCLGEHYAYVDGCEWTHTDNVTYCEYESEYVWNDDAVELLDGEYTHSDNAVLLKLGTHRGEYMHTCDVQLVYLCGLAMKEGTLSC